MLVEAIEISILKIWSYRLRAWGRLIPQHADVNAVAAARRAAHQESLFRGIQFRAGDHPLPDLALHQQQQRFGSSVRYQRALLNQRNIGRSRLNVRDDMRLQNNNPFTGKLRKQVAKTHSLFGVQTRCGFIHNQQLRVV